VSFAIVSLIIVVPVVVIGVILFAVLTRQAARRNPNRPENGGRDESDDRKHGPDRR
jgi:hypothetical protein